MPILQLVQRREQQALRYLRRKLGKPRKCEGHRKVDVSAMRHHAHERTKERVQNLRGTKKGPNHLQKRDKEQPNADTDTSPQDNSDTVSTCATSADTEQTAVKRRNQILSDIKKYESMSFQEGPTGASFKAEALAKLRTELELVQQDLPQPLPRNTDARKDKEAKMLKQELSNNMAKIQNLMAMKQKLETETNDILKRLEEAEAERDLAFNQMGQEQASETNQEDATRARQQSSQSSILTLPRSLLQKRWDNTSQP